MFSLLNERLTCSVLWASKESSTRRLLRLPSPPIRDPHTFSIQIFIHPSLLLYGNNNSMFFCNFQHGFAFENNQRFQLGTVSCTCQDNQWAILFVSSCPNLHSFLASFTYSSIWGHVKLNRTFVHVCHKMKWVAVGSSLLDNEPLKRHDFLFIVGGKTLGWKP